MGCHSQRRPESLFGRKFLIFQANFRVLHGEQIFRLWVNTLTAPDSFQRARPRNPVFLHHFSPYPAAWLPFHAKS